MASQFVTLRHEIHGGVAEFPAATAQQWMARGWRPLGSPEPPKKTEQVSRRVKEEKNG